MQQQLPTTMLFAIPLHPIPRATKNNILLKTDPVNLSHERSARVVLWPHCYCDAKKNIGNADAHRYYLTLADCSFSASAYLIMLFNAGHMSSIRLRIMGSYSIANSRKVLATRDNSLSLR